MPFTKIICTIGPSSQNPDVLARLIMGGMNVARLNFAHGSYEEHAAKVATIRKVAADLNKPVAILQDLSGPKIRVGVLPEAGVMLNKGEEVVLSANPEPGEIPVTYKELADEVKEGDLILLADGLLEIVVASVHEGHIHCQVTSGGLLTSHKGINLPTASLKVPSMTEKDKNDLAFGLSQGVDYVGLSFVRQASDIEDLKAAMGNRLIPIIAKIEKHEAVKNIDAILEAADGIMVARGDLGVEIPLEEVPGVQKMIIKKANAAGKPVITATQMLRSMVESPRPTRAEATDVANAVLDGTDAVMLSEETAMGQHPVGAVQYMAKIARTAENQLPLDRYMKLTPEKDVAESVAYASCSLAYQLSATAIVTSTVSGITAHHISRFRPHCPIIALSPEPATLRHLCLYFGVRPFPAEAPDDADDLIESSARHALETGLTKKGDIIIITAGHPVGGAGTTNMLRVYKL
ncbi:MAG: pyruvate kinase [Thermodesulfobacteriota bacterium]